MEKEKFERFIAKMEVQANLSWKKEVKIIKGELEDLNKPLRILEIGSGPGIITERLLKLFPNSKITALEIDENAYAYAKEKLSGKYGDRVEFIQGDITTIELEKEKYDIVYSRLVLQHVHGVQAAVKNAFNVLKKDGHFIITDIDEGLFGIIDPPMPHLQYVLKQHIQEQIIEGGDRFIGRKLYKMLKENQFSEVELNLLAINSDDVGIESFVPQVDYKEMGTMIDNNLISQEDIDKVREETERFKNGKDSYALLVMFSVIGKK